MSGINYLSVENISKSYGLKTLFEGLSFGIEQGQKIALIGLNGSGKSTLLKVLSGEEQPDSGRLSYRNGITISFLKQDPTFDAGKTVGDIVFDAEHPTQRLIRQYESLLKRLAEEPEIQDQLDRVTAQMEATNAWEYELKIKQVLSKLGINDLETEIQHLSGGQQKRVAIAQALIQEPELIIMDEPTNHLDLASIEWLEKVLSSSKQSILLVTHDRYFLDSITDEILELDKGKLFSYKGNYAYYLTKKSERTQALETQVERAKSLFAKELEWLRRSPKARGTKAKARIDAANELESKSQISTDDKTVNLRMKGRRIGGKVLEIKKLRKSFGDLTILDDFTYTFNRRDRIGIVGPNGVGKTSFINMLIGELEPDSGKVRKGETIYFGHYKQSGLSFKPDQKVIDVVREVAEVIELSKSEKISAPQLLEHFLFPYDMHYAKVETLSGGEKRRLHLLRILMTNPNFLILDEPTNDLDLITLRKLEEFLAEFDGCLLVVSHDRYFMDRLIDHLFIFEGEGKVKDFPGSYSQYRQWKTQQEALSDQTQTQTQTVSPSKSNSKEKGKSKLSFNEKREFEQLENEIARLEEEKAKVLQGMNHGENDYKKIAELSEKLESIESSLSEKSDRWLELAEFVE